jgi:hypothetical protein
MPSPGNAAWRRKTPKTAIPYVDRVRRYRFGQFLKRNREKFGLKATRTAQYLDLTTARYWAMERGYANPPSQPTAWMPKLARLFEVGIDEVYYHLGILDPDLIDLMGEHLWKYPDLASHIRKILLLCEDNPDVILPAEDLDPENDPPPEDQPIVITPFIPGQRRRSAKPRTWVRQPKPGETALRFPRGRPGRGKFYDCAMGNEHPVYLADDLDFPETGMKSGDAR